MTAAMYSVLLLVTVLVVPIAGLSEEKPADSVLEPPELPEQWREFDNEHADLDYGSTDVKPDFKKKKYPVKPPAMSQEVNKDEAVIDRQLTRNEGMLMDLRGRPEQASSHQIDPEAGVNMQMTKHEELMKMAAPQPRVNRIGAQPRVNQIATTTTTTAKRPENIERIFLLLIYLSASTFLTLLVLLILKCLLEKRWNKEECHPDPDPEPVPDPEPERPRRRSVTFSEYLPTRRSVMESEGRYNEGNGIDTESEDSLNKYYVRDDGDHLMEQVETESESSEEEVEEVESSEETECKENVSQNFKEESATELQNRQQYKHSQKAKQQTLHVSMEQPNIGLPDKQQYSCPQEPNIALPDKQQYSYTQGPNIGLQYKQLYNYKQEPNITLYACSQESDRSSQDKVLYNNRQKANIRLKNAYAYKTLQRNYKEPYIAINGKIYRCWEEVDTEPQEIKLCRYEEINEIAPKSKGRKSLKKFKSCFMKPCVLD
ncbi:uncharacterized protein LOC121385175 [Gigantopelta aegis]|uniref:uncharacterized protein LOC121385175 n=1 Tax=Gigantopelta aegis TaxID=1735272 RepID=UPI001B888C18|nr:uncharacterized protein LOC121385175 [Gigantopelta aegis]